MRIASLTLVGNKRLGVRNIKYVHLDFTSEYQLLVGANGSGKSTILRELSVLPAASSDYEKTGSKTVVVYHQGSTYKVISDFSKGGHYFEKDGEVLNDYGTQSVQLTLVKEHFGLTRDIFNLLTGVKKFTDMNAQERRKWLMDLSGLNLDLAMKIFMEFKNRARDSQGFVKQSNKRLSEETQKLVNDEDFNNMCKDLDVLNEELRMFLTETKQVNGNYHETKSMLEKTASHFFDTLVKVEESIPDIPSYYVMELGIRSNQGLRDHILRLQTTLEHKEVMLSNLYKEKDNLRALAEKIAQGSQVDLDQFQELITNLRLEKERLSKDIRKYNYPSDQVKTAYATMKAILPDLEEGIRNLRDNSDSAISREKETQGKERQVVLRRILIDIERNIARAEHDLEHIRKSDILDCPKCEHKFKPGISPGSETRIEEALKVMRDDLSKFTIEYETIGEYLAECLDFRGKLLVINNIIKQNPIHQPLWDRFIEYNFAQNPPRILLDDIRIWSIDLETQLNLLDVETSLVRREEAFAHAQELKSLGSEFNADRETGVNVEIDTTLSEIDHLRREINNGHVLVSKLEILDEAVKRLDNIAEKLDHFHGAFETIIENDFVKTITEEISRESSELTRLVNSVNVHRELVKDLERSVVSAKEESELLSLLENEMSPTNGFIAEVIRKFTTVILSNMNATINSVWTTTLEVLPCKPGRKEMDYAFPMEVFGSPLHVPDVSEGSSSQLDIVNFAFKVTAMKLLNMEDYPLYLDELAATMDDQHRINIMRVVSNIVATNRCSQMFMISHYAAEHGQFRNAEILVTDPTNIVTLPKHFNTHATLK